MIKPMIWKYVMFLLSCVQGPILKLLGKMHYTVAFSLAVAHDVYGVEIFTKVVYAWLSLLVVFLPLKATRCC